MNGFWEMTSSGRDGCARRGGHLLAPGRVGRAGDPRRRPKALDQLMREMLDLVQRARTGVLRSSEVSDATITVTNLGEQGVELVWGVIYPPQVALVGSAR